CRPRCGDRGRGTRTSVGAARSGGRCGRGRTITRTRTARRSFSGGVGGTRRCARCRSRRRKDSAAVSIARWFEFTELFAWADLHVSRWRLWRQAMLNDVSMIAAVPMCYDRQGFAIPKDPEDWGGEFGWMMLPTRRWAQMM